MSQLSVLVPFVPRRSEQVLPYAGMVEWTAARRLWQGQSVLLETHQAFAAAAGAGFRVPVGLGVTLLPLRHPYEAAVQARSLALATGHPVLAGFGPGSRELQAGMLGAPYASPLTAAREYLSTVRGLLDGEEVRLDGSYVKVHAKLPQVPAPRVDLGLGVLRPGMARLAGELADAAITWLTPPHYIRDVLQPAIREGMARVGRTTPPRLVAMVPVAVERDDAPENVVLAGNSAHLQAPHYLDMLRTAGVNVPPGDLTAAVRGVLETDAFVHGTLDDVIKKIHTYTDAGVDEIVLNVTGVHKVHGPRAGLEDLKNVIRAGTAGGGR
ncbi:LLM class flavin-dependent oxidoreductase [Actinoplanes sp. N902-109]|uniref:LLM class flavin-dependent oxidoreductase n=1 Tax=Actinoplanes sp. (strain N902-109) TaxID=649831 RepID=UPI00032957BF|nr:LLM class flavin-dependent oxidoreductase [Actinoplanes sp. N902-109]AGL13771.1 coenzyme F420-dependent N5 N10-methylene tetrahydromethanopterin reductase and related flavin-dependent oxidoreductase [Actinoplanes sp. N902-109]